MLSLVTQLCLTLCDPTNCSLPGSFVHGDSPGNNTAVGCHVLLQGIFPTQELNPGLSHCRRILYPLSHQGSPRILEWVAYPFSRVSPLLRNWTGVSCIAGRFFTSWATREALNFSPIGGYLGYSQFHDGFNFGGLLLSVDCPNEGPFPQIKGSSVTLMNPEIATKLVIKWRYYESQKEFLGNSRQ